MINQPPWRADNDMRPPVELPAFSTGIHAANTGRNHGARIFKQPCQLALDLKCQLACWRNDQGQRLGRWRQRHRAAFRTAAMAGRHRIGQQNRGQPQPIGHGLAGARLGGHEQITVGQFRICHGNLDSGEGIIALLAQGFGKQGMQAVRCGGRMGHAGTFIIGCVGSGARACTGIEERM